MKRRRLDYFDVWFIILMLSILSIPFWMWLMGAFEK